MAYDTLASEDSIQKAANGLAARNVMVHVVGTKEEALAKIRELIPAGKDVMTGSSVSLEQMGFVDLLKSGDHPWHNLKDAIVNEKDPARQNDLRKHALLSEWFLASVHAVTEDGVIIVGSKSGSQIPSYSFTSDNVIWVIGTQKIVPSFEDGMKRIRDYVVPLEDQHMQSLGWGHTELAKLFIFNKETSPTRKIHAILVKEKLGF